MEIIDATTGRKIEWNLKDRMTVLQGQGVQNPGKAAILELADKVNRGEWKVTYSNAQNGHGSFPLYETLRQTRDPRATCDAYMEWCASQATLPVFYNFADHENYYKLVYDFSVYDNVDGSYAGQQAVTNTYPMQTANGIQAVNVLNGGFDTAYLRETIEKQMSAMNRYNENLHADLEGLADRMVEGTVKHSAVTAEEDARYLELARDPVTYDDKGNVIPLSERFNEKFVSLSGIEYC